MEFLYNTGFVPGISIENTDTVGSQSYIVAMECGGVMEDPDIHYEKYQLIRAESEKEAVEKYNKLNNCNYYYGKVIEWPQNLPWL